MKEKTREFLLWLSARLKEPTTYHGFNLMIVAIGISIEPRIQQTITACGMAIASLIFIVTEEKK